jgi:hypothetical protein
MAAADILANRAVGQYPISIATSLAIESLNGIHPEIVVTKPPILKYPRLWINVRTLYRNLMGAVERENQGLLLPPEIAQTVSEEMDSIPSIVNEVTGGKTDVVYYFSNMSGMERKYKHATLRRDTTEKQKEYTLIMQNVVDLLLKHHSDEIRGFDLKIKPHNNETGRTLLLTHIPYDLVSWQHFDHLTLIESHTGALKERAQWYTKYENGKELSMIPFREDFLQVFGDKETFRPMDIRLRRDLIAVATKYHWTAVTTREKILYGIDQIQNPYFRTLLRDILVSD